MKRFLTVFNILILCIFLLSVQLVLMVSPVAIAREMPTSISPESQGLLNIRPYDIGDESILSRDPTEIINRTVEQIGTDFKNNPLRTAYENEVRDLANLARDLQNRGLGLEERARTLYQARRDLGVKYKNVTPWPLREYIYDVNKKRYNDPLGPSFEYLVNKYSGDYERIIQSAQRPNPDINKLLSGFRNWLSQQDGDYLDRIEREFLRSR
ncbi:MAG: hypothetical protein AAGA60_07165 [Cyanobacteria bacterium P01_E01_bin.42]